MYEINKHERKIYSMVHEKHLEDILKLYRKDTFSIEDNIIINNAIELELI